MELCLFGCVAVDAMGGINVRLAYVQERLIGFAHHSLRALRGPHQRRDTIFAVWHYYEARGRDGRKRNNMSLGCMGIDWDLARAARSRNPWQRQ